MQIPSILLVDDDDIDTEIVQRAFAQQQIANPLICATDGRQALDILRGKASSTPPLAKPYIILLDINMPRMNGLEFLHELRQDPDLKSTVVFVLTTSTNPEDQEAAYNKLIAGYILKQNVGLNFVNAIGLLKAYQTLVVLPD